MKTCIEPVVQSDAPKPSSIQIYNHTFDLISKNGPAKPTEKALFRVLLHYYTAEKQYSVCELSQLMTDTGHKPKQLMNALMKLDADNWIAGVYKPGSGPAHKRIIGFDLNVGKLAEAQS